MSDVTRPNDIADVTLSAYLTGQQRQQRFMARDLCNALIDPYLEALARRFGKSDRAEQDEDGAP